MKKIIRMLICVQLLLVLIAQTVFAQDTGKGADIQSKKNYLIEKGYDEEILSYLSDDNINSVYHKLKYDFHGKAKVSAQINRSGEMISNYATRAAINKTQLEIKSIVNNYMYDSGEILGCELILSYEWLVTPTTNGKDAITVNWDPTYFSLAEMGGFNGSSSIINSATENEEFFNFGMTVNALNTGGAGWNIDVFKSDTEKTLQTNPKGQMTLFFEPNYSFNASDDVVMRFTTMYYQNKATDDSLINFSTNGSGVQAVGVSTDTMRNIVQYISNMVDVTG